ncbi:unnamed protein product [Ectocarpus sp. CCAP 1310/34]|nr:unnamed protein product [Ectocarpus sp. CCAP 1310/34]
MDPGAGAQVDGGDGLVSIVTTGLRGVRIAPRTAAAAQPPTGTDTAPAAAAAAAAPTPSRSAFEYMTINQAVKEACMYPPEDSWESDEIASDSEEEGLPRRVYAPAYKNGPLRSKTRWGRRNGKPYYPDWYTESMYEPVDVPFTEDAEIQEGEQGEEPSEGLKELKGGIDGDDNNMDVD